MEKRKLHNYLKTYRKRASLSQDELAYLLGMSGEVQGVPLRTARQGA